MRLCAAGNYQANTGCNNHQARLSRFCRWLYGCCRNWFEIVYWRRQLSMPLFCNLEFPINTSFTIDTSIDILDWYPLTLYCLLGLQNIKFCQEAVNL